MGAEHSRRSHARRNQQTTSASVPVTSHGALALVQEDPNNKSTVSNPANTELLQRKKRRQMDRLRRTLSFRSRKKNNNNNSSSDASTTNNNNNSNNNNNNHSTSASTKPTSTTSGTTTADSKPIQWQDDEKAVRVGTCSFNVKYLGSVEVQESRGMHVCEQAIQALLNHKGKHMKAVLHISGDALRVVDETNKGLTVDQTIEKVSFCAPDRHHEKGFAYICRDGTTRRWLCHGFLAIKDSGERLSHAVGCAFQICLERKQKRDRECSVTVEYTQNGTSFTRFGSFRTTTITERIIDPQSAIVAEPIPTNSLTISNSSHNATFMKSATAMERPRPKGTDSDTFIRSASLRLGDLNQPITTGFKRQSSLRPSDLPSIQEAKCKILPANTIPEEVEPVVSSNELNKLSLIDSTNTTSSINGHPIGSSFTNEQFTLPFAKPSMETNSSINSILNPPYQQSQFPAQPVLTNENLSTNLWLTNTSQIVADSIPNEISTTTTTTTTTTTSVPASINDAFNSNLTALVQSNNPTNPFSPYGYSMAAQAQSPHTNHRQPTIFTPKRGTNPFDDDLIRR